MTLTLVSTVNHEIPCPEEGRMKYRSWTVDDALTFSKLNYSYMADEVNDISSIPIIISEHCNIAYHYFKIQF